ncbi:MAG: N4-gp56 family major capsid protein, partial [Deltaproteobacteria bacterium]|nr:N4-gp56 family major capsid protein [Deltaproteobacteria bacterium]
MTDFEAPHIYGNTAGTTSTVGGQIRTDYFQRKALTDAVKESFFGQLADVVSMPKNMGKTIKRFHYLPILDNRNLSDQGIDAEGASLAADWTAATSIAKQVISAVAPAAAGGMTFYFEGTGTGADIATGKGLADDEAEMRIHSWAIQSGNVPAATANYAATKTALEGLGWTVTVENTGEEWHNRGNLYGSSKDVGTISRKIPALSETGGRVNRVGMKRIQLSGTLEKFGFFDEYTQESLDFDSDADLLQHLTTESVRAANEITEDQLQIDLLAGAGVVRFAGNATSVATLNGGTAAANAEDVVVYDDLVKLGIELDNNRCPKNTKLITGSRMVDTKVVNSARYAYIGSELQPALMRMVDYHSARAFLPVAQYGAATTLARGEFGSVADFRFIVVPEMQYWEGAGAAVGDSSDEVCAWS